jgi:hypothetical protein
VAGKPPIFAIDSTRVSQTRHSDFFVAETYLFYKIAPVEALKGLGFLTAIRRFAWLFRKSLGSVAWVRGRRQVW